MVQKAPKFKVPAKEKEPEVLDPHEIKIRELEEKIKKRKEATAARLAKEKEMMA
tara:strand:- start:991 stop:1152 length:162 start_codon:yes stop_codon:yes gene_type:complete